jgi:hypothetical protein
LSFLQINPFHTTEQNTMSKSTGKAKSSPAAAEAASSQETGATDEQIVQAVVALLETQYGKSRDEALALLRRACSYQAERAGIAPSKFSNGGSFGESIICKHLNLRWNTEKRGGADAFDSCGNPVELKSSENAALVKAKKVDINYVVPARRKAEFRGEYLGRIRAHYDAVTGGHVWAIVSTQGNQAKVIKCWRFSGDFVSAILLHKVAALLARDPDRVRFHINLTGGKCKACDTVHKYDYFQEQEPAFLENPNPVMIAEMLAHPTPCPLAQTKQGAARIRVKPMRAAQAPPPQPPSPDEESPDEASPDDKLAEEGDDLK